jgi:hypothetical protein
MVTETSRQVKWNCFMFIQIGDETGQLTAQMNLADLRQVLGINGNVNQ